MQDKTPQLTHTTPLLCASQAGYYVNDIIEVENCKSCFVSHTVCSTKKVIGVVTKSRKEHLIAQTHEFACTKELLPQVIATGTCISFVSCVL